MQTSEEYEVGVHTQIRDNFRVFDDFDAGIRGYFEFINYSRYANLKGVTSPEEYCRRIKADGYATSNTYIDTLLKVIRDNNLTRFDTDEPKNEEPKKEDGDNMKKEELTGEVLSGKEIIDILAKRVINGDYGKGEERRKKLGDLYSVVQKRANEMLK